MLYTGLLEVEDTIFVANEAVTEGLAIMSLGVLEDKSISNVSFAGNVPHCPASQYGYEEDIGNSVRHARLHTDERRVRCLDSGQVQRTKCPFAPLTASRADGSTPSRYASRRVRTLA